MFSVNSYKDTNLDGGDIFKFYTLYNHLSKVSPNIGIIANRKEFNKRINKVIDSLKDRTNIIIKKNKDEVRIIENGIETNYIRLDNITDLYNNYFRKYIY